VTGNGNAGDSMGRHARSLLSGRCGGDGVDVSTVTIDFTVITITVTFTVTIDSTVIIATVTVTVVDSTAPA